MAENIAITWRRIPERYRLEATRDPQTGEVFFPPRVLSPTRRRKAKLEKITLSGQGEIFSYTQVNSAPAGLEKTTPYVLAIIKLNEGPMLTSQVVEVEEKDVKIGDKVEMIFRKIRSDDPEGLLHYGYKFRKVT